jgi:phage-related protein
MAIFFGYQVFFAGASLIVLTNGFAKKSQKTPRQEIDRATRRKNEYLSRQRNV